MKVISEGIETAPQEGGTTLTIDERLYNIEKALAKKLMHLSERIRSLEEIVESLQKENRKLWKALKEVESAVDSDNWVSEELQAEAYARSEQRFKDFGFWAVRA